MKNSTPPLLRGIGTLLVMIAGALAICIARQEPIQAALSPAPPSRVPEAVTADTAKDNNDEDVAALTAEIRELREEVEQQDVVDQVLDNTWFNWVSIAGTAVIAASFFTEAYLRRREMSHGDHRRPLAPGTP